MKKKIFTLHQSHRCKAAAILDQKRKDGGLKPQLTPFGAGFTFQNIFVLLVILVFCLFKFKNLSFRFGDGNAYFYMAKTILDGNLPYRDFFFADPPTLILFLTPFYLLFKNNLLILQALPIVLECINALLIYLLLRRWKNPFAFLTPAFYLFSFSILATSDYLTGVQLTIFLSLLAILLYEKGRSFWSGFVFTLSFLTKLYALPAFIGFGIFIFLEKNYRAFFKFVLGTTVAFFLVLGPFLLISFRQTVNCLLVHHLHRPAGLNKIEVFTFFLKREWFLLVLAIAGIFVYKRKFLLVPFVSTLSFLLVFRDLYYVYLSYLLPFLIIFALLAVERLSELKEGRNLILAILVFYSFFMVFSFSKYKQTFFFWGRFLNANEMVEYVKTLPSDFGIYGSHEVAPLIALLSNRSLFDNQIDTNVQVFASGAQDLKLVSQKAVNRGVYLVSRITDFPEYGIKDFGYEGFFAKELFEKYCKRQKTFPDTIERPNGLVAIYFCRTD